WHHFGQPPNPCPVALRAHVPAARTFSARPHRFPPAPSLGWLSRSPWTPTPSASRHRGAPPRDPCRAAPTALVPAARTLSARPHFFPPAPSLDWLRRSPWTPTLSASRHRGAPSQDPASGARSARAPVVATSAARRDRLPQPVALIGYPTIPCTALWRRARLPASGACAPAAGLPAIGCVHSPTVAWS